MKRSATSHFIVAALVGLVCSGGWACRSEPEVPSPGDSYQVPELKFSGSDLIYVLRRLAGEAGIPLVLDELRSPETTMEDLARITVDLDIEAGSLGDAMSAVQQAATGQFEHRVEDGALVVRSSRVLEGESQLDVPGFGPQSLNTDLAKLIQQAAKIMPPGLLRLEQSDPVAKAGEALIEIPEGSSIVDMLVLYSRASGTGIRIRRGGYEYKGPAVPKNPYPGMKMTTFLANTVQPWPPIKTARTNLPPAPRGLTTIAALAQIQERTKTPVCVIDRALHWKSSGSLIFVRGPDPLEPLEESLTALTAWRRPGPPSYEWDRVGSVVSVHSSAFLQEITGKELLEAHVNAGHFEGTLAGLTRWINRNRKSPSSERLLGGEIDASQPSAVIDIADDSTVEEVLYQFAAAAGEGWNLVAWEPAAPTEQAAGSAAGAFVTRLSEWMPNL